MHSSIFILSSSYFLTARAGPNEMRRGLTVRGRHVECGGIIVVYKRVTMHRRMPSVWNNGKDDDVYVLLLIRWVDVVGRIGLSLSESKVFRWSLAKVFCYMHFVRALQDFINHNVTTKLHTSVPTNKGAWTDRLEFSLCSPTEISIFCM
jgi:hypothetical protein